MSDSDELREAQAAVMMPETETLNRWHHGRRFHGPDRLSVECPCPKTPCGLTEFGAWEPTCAFHGPTKTVRQAHAPEDCPGHEVLA